MNGVMRRAAVWAATLAALGAVAMAAPAAALPLGALAQLRGKAGCVSEGGKGGCASARGLGGPPVAKVSFVTVSPDGRNAYAVGEAITVFSRDRRTGRLTQRSGTAGCISATGAPARCATARGLAYPGRLAISPDGRGVYVTSGDRVLVFARNRGTGALTQLAGESGCVSGTAVAGCAPARGLRVDGLFAGQVAVTSDGRSVYVAAPGGAVVAFARDAVTGALTQLSGEAGCAARTGLGGCAIARAIETPFALAASPAGGSLYILEPNDFDVTDASGVVTFARDSSSGALTQLPGQDGCLSDTTDPTPGCGRARALVLPGSVTVSPDGRSVYVPGEEDQDIAGDVAVLRRKRQTGSLTQPKGKRGCLSLESGCTRLRVIFGPRSLAVSPDGRSAYLVGDSDPFAPGGGGGAIEVLARSKSGTLSRLAGTAGCVRRRRGNGCAGARAIKDARWVAVSPDGRNVYVASGQSAAIAVFARSYKRTRRSTG